MTISAKQKIEKARSKATNVMVGICIIALITALFWAILLMRSVTDRKQAEERIQKFQIYLQDMIDAMPSIMASVDRDCKIKHLNKKAEAVSGKEAQSIIGNNIIDVFSFLDIHKEDISKAIRSQSHKKDLRISSGENGALKYWDLSIFPLIKDEGGGAVIRIDDISERVKMNEIMIQTEKMMSVGGLAAGMAHEINNPLGIMMQAAQNVSRRLSPDLKGNIKSAEKYGIKLKNLESYLVDREIDLSINDIRTAGKRAAEIVKNMLQFSRKSEIAFEMIDLNALIDQTIELASHDYNLKKKFDFKQIKIKKVFQADLPLVPLVKTEIEQVIFNFLKNGAQAMAGKSGDGPPLFVIRTMRKDNNAVMLINDNGIGIKKTILNRVFEPFFTTKPAGEGTGLGLSVSYMIVTGNHHGQITVESEIGVGSSFTISLPLEQHI